MKIALINENSQAAKNAQIYEVLNEEAQKAGHTVFNYGMYSAEDDVQLTYVKNGLLASILLTTKAVDFVVTGCGTGQGAMLACNSFPNVLCGHITDAVDAYLFGQVNDGNCIAMPFAQGFGWVQKLIFTILLKNCSQKHLVVDTLKNVVNQNNVIKRS